MNTKHVIALIKKDLLLEWRKKYALYGAVLYVISTIFICYLSFKDAIDITTWNALFWIILLFSALNTISRNFQQDTAGKQLYHYTLSSPQSFIIAKIVYNSLVILFLAFISLFIYTLFMGNQIENMGLFIATLVLASTGFGTTLSMVSSIAIKTNNNVTLMSILSFPILLPLLLVLIKVSLNAVIGLSDPENLKLIIVLVSINLTTIVLSYLLFPYLWRD